ncbi:MAG: cell surface protein SprA [Paludibacteraceae bacterium]|nr:cell surface protein SprA [Paludibacteraceae bacterium]
MKITGLSVLLLVAAGVCAQAQEESLQAQDTTRLRYPVQKTFSETQEDLRQVHPADLPQPDNLDMQVQYDADADRFYFTPSLGEESLSTPFYMTGDEYVDFSSRKSLSDYYRNRVKEEKGKKHELSLTDMKFDIGQADKIFGPGGVQLKLQGSAELIFGLNFKRLKDPSLSERSQHPAPAFDFDEKIQLSVQGSVGDKLSVTMNYNTEATFDFDQSLLKLQYEGKEDDIIKKLEAGNVSMPLSGSLITGSTSLFGVKTELQFGKLTIGAVVSQQESESKTLNTNGAQTSDFEIDADEYDENRHFFLSHYFRDHYDEWMEDLPNIASGINIGEIEVWVTNKNSVSYTNTTNIVGFADLGEPSTIFNPAFAPTGTVTVPDNRANSLFETVVQAGGGLPDIYDIDSYLGGFGMVATTDYVKLEGARKLESTEYTVNAQLGYISLRSALNNDEMLAVAFQYTYQGKVYHVGQLSKGTEPTKPLALKLLKSTDKSPYMPTWNLMMKNIYSLGAYQVQQDKFKLNIMYRNDSTGIDLSYITEGPVAKQQLLRVMGLDRLDSRLQTAKNGDGVFDFVEGYTILSQNGRIIFPVVEPFGSHLAKMLGGQPALVEKYVYQELYDSTLTTAQEFAEKNKFYLKGEYRASSGSEIRLNAMNVPQGSVKVMAGGAVLTENVDYTVDYMMGVVTIMNEDLIALGTPISVSLESQSLFNMQRKSLVGAHLDYAFSDHFNLGGTIMHLSEKPLTEKVGYGEDPVSNTMWGLNASYRNQFQSITDWLNKMPLLNLKQASTFGIDAEFAQMIPGTARGAKGRVYLDDFESTKVGFDVRYASNWRLASTPARFAESQLTNNIEYGKNRALLAWYYIDNMFTRGTSNTPTYIRQDKEQLSSHFVREVSETEIFPNRELVYGQSTYLQTLDLSYYPNERGPYNVYAPNFDSEGHLTNPKAKWAGISRRLETTDFETNNIEYLEFWLMDPFVYNDGSMTGGTLYIDLGEISEDVLKDGRKFYENGLSSESDADNTVETSWGRVPTKQSVVYTFDTDPNQRGRQDTGLNGLLTEEEFNFDTYRNFLNELDGKLTDAARERMRNDAFSPLNDPAGDNFHHYRGTDYDNDRVGILERYKHYNGTEGNSPVQTGTSYTTASTNNPDVEDINSDNTMNEADKYFEYEIPLRPSEMQVGSNFISDVVSTEVTLADGNKGAVRWYQFKVPLRDADRYTTVGGIRSFKSIRFMRMYLTDFEEETHLRFATMELVKGEWRQYS